ncbi:phosphomevalonate kinase (plasmid) [Streptomyces globisporus]|nr:phosphomevalonate kinase [Streptomyces globisporus]
MTPASTTRRAPGKLMVAGEYAVLEPGRPAIAVAVDRYVNVTVSTCSSGEGDVVVDSDLLPHKVALRRTPQGLRALSEDNQSHASGLLSHVVSAVETIEQLRIEHRLSLASVKLSVHSELHRGGVKTGLGSSAAVTAATTQALADHYGMSLSTEDRFRLAMLASVQVDAGPSGTDLAAATWRGWVSYRSPDRQALRDALHRHSVLHTLKQPWPHLTIRPLPPPTGLALHVGWSGTPASTTALVSDLTTRPTWQVASLARFLDDSEQCVTAMERALQQDTPQLLLDAVRTARSLLSRLDAETALGIFTPPLRRLCEVAESCGAAAKPSGAGGGDCGIALLPAHRSAGPLHRRWTASDITPLGLRAISTAVTRSHVPTVHDTSPSASGHKP